MLHLAHDMLEPANPTYAYVNAFVDELRRCGVHNAVVCPGSRSTPLAMALAEQPDLRVWMHVDERSAAFFALGMAKRSGQPAALLCTSGTAAANFLPALVEAKLTHVPLLVLTADRPPELRDNGAPQAIDQNRLYGTHVKWFAEAALPEATNEALRYIRTLACRATALTQSLPAGPVHLNLPFREPLIPTSLPHQPLPPPEQRDPIAWHGRPDNAPYITVYGASLAELARAPAEMARRHTNDLFDRFKRSPHGLIVVGPQSDPLLAEQLVKLARQLGYPILADPLSQLRSFRDDLVISSYDAFLRLDAFIAQAEPQLILRFGAMPTAKPLLLYLKRYASCPQIIIDGYGDWNEPTQLAAEMIHADPRFFCSRIQGKLLWERRSSLLEKPLPDDEGEPDVELEDDFDESVVRRSTWLRMWQRADLLTKQVLQEAIDNFEPLFEGRIFTELVRWLPSESTLYVGNSMPVRDMDTFFWGETNGPIWTMGNRGANGIDGVVSSALGASAAELCGDPTVLVIGDLSFFHDLNGLLAAKLHHLNLVIVLVNNDGGGIFSFLPQAAYPQHFEQLFGTPTGLDFEPVVRMYGGHFQRITSWEEFRQVMSQGLAEGGLHVIEVPTERASNVSMHRQLWQLVEKALHER